MFDRLHDGASRSSLAATRQTTKLSRTRVGRAGMLPPSTTSEECWDEAAAAITAYGRARKTFREVRMRHPELLAGNDNLVGCAGEYWVKRRYHNLGYRITEVPLSNNEGYDFRCEKDGNALRVSVKV